MTNAHNMMFNTLSCMVGCATMLEVSPRLQQHKITAAAVAISEAAMVRASQVRMMAIVIDLIFAHRRDVTGPKSTSLH